MYNQPKPIRGRKEYDQLQQYDKSAVAGGVGKSDDRLGNLQRSALETEHGPRKARKAAT